MVALAVRKIEKVRISDDVISHREFKLLLCPKITNLPFIPFLSSISSAHFNVGNYIHLQLFPIIGITLKVRTLVRAGDPIIRTIKIGAKRKALR